MSELRKRQNRFKPKSEIEWLDRDSRKEHRRTIAVLTDLTMALEKRAVLTPAQDQQIRALTQSDAIDTRLNGMWDILEQTESAYLEKLAAMGPHDLSAYHEFVNPHEPPAEHHYFMCDHLMRVEAGEIATLILALPPGAAKALALDTPIPTPNGWTTMGELKVGDKVFDENGEPCSVTWVSPVWKNRPVYKVETDCGDMIIADREHEWLVCRDRESGVFEIKETHALLPKRGKRPMVKRAKALVTDESDLPIDPYLLGVWLGDGTSASVSITSSTEDRVWLRSEIERLGYKTTDRAAKDLFGVVGVRDRFVSLGLLNDPHHKTHGRKHIPQAYMRASYRQRLALVQGMVDSDGTVCKRRGAATFCNINKELALSFRELVRSLGIKAGWSVGRAVLNGVDHGEVYRVSFYHEEAARMPRKAALCRNQSRTPNTYLEITPNGFADTVCIEVDSPSHLFLCGESMTPTHNSTYSSRTFAQWCLGRNPDWRVLACGHSQKFCEDEFSKPNRTALDSPQFAAVFPDVQLNPMEKGASFWRLMGWRGSYACRGALAGTAGLRARIILGDDLFKNAADAMSEVVRSNIWRWWTADVMSRRLPNAPMVLVNTLWHSDDVPNKLKALSEENPAALPQPFVFINLPAEAGDDDPLGRRPGEWLWCKEQQDDGFYTINDYETKRATMPPSLWSALYLGQPLDRMGDYISEDQFHRYEKPPVNRQGHEMQWVKTVMSIDTASTGKDRADYTAILIFRKHVDGTHYLVDVWRDKVTLEKVVRVIAKLMRHWQVNHAIVEDSGMGAQLLENYQGKLPAPLVSYTPAGKGSKDFRFDAAAPWITSGKVLFPKEAPWLANFVNELVAFPNGANDDQVDAFSMYTDCELKTRAGGTKPLRMRG